MAMSTRAGVFTLVALSAMAAVSACRQHPVETAGEPASAPASAPVAAPPTALALPAVDTANAQQFVTESAALVPLAFARVGSTTVEGEVSGYSAPIYAVPVAAGQTLTVAFKSDSANLYANVSDATDHSGAALHRGETDGDTATLKADKDITFVIQPYQPRAMARRGEKADFTLTVSRN